MSQASYEMEIGLFVVGKTKGFGGKAGISEGTTLVRKSRIPKKAVILKSINKSFDIFRWSDQMKTHKLSYNFTLFNHEYPLALALNISDERCTLTTSNTVAS